MAIFKFFSKSDKRTQILILILLFIGFQQFPVIYVGGSLKIYEVLGLIMLFSFGIRQRKDYLVTCMYIFFVVSPLVSLLSFYLCDDVGSYYNMYPETQNSFRFNIYIFPLLQLLFMIMNYAVLYNLYCNREVYKRFDSVVRGIIIIGTCIAIYSIIALFSGDPISHLPQFIQNKHVYDFRSSGLSQEPSSYILYQGWIVLLCWFSKNLFSKEKWIAILSINTISILLTFSSTLVLFAGVIGLMIFLFSRLLMKLIYVAVFASMLFASYMFLAKFVDIEVLNYALIQKIEDFLIGKEDAGGSGGFRNYESSLGWIIYKENPLLGVGVGNSTFFMHLAAEKSDIIPMGEQLDETSFPPNTFPCVFAEQGTLGGGIFVLMLFIILRRAWKGRYTRYGKVFLTAIVFNIGCFMMIAPQYSMYLWMYMFMAMGYYKAEERKLLENDESCNRL